MGGEHFAAQLAKVGEPGTEVVGELLVDFAAKTLGEGGAFPGSGDGDLEIAAGDDGAEEEIAIGMSSTLLQRMLRSRAPA